MSAMLRTRGDSSLSPYGGRVQTRIEVRPVKGDEHRAAGAATARAYEEFAPQRRDGWLAYLDRIADVGGRAERATVLVAIVDGHVAGSVTLELDRRIREDPESPLAPDEAHVRMLGVDPAYRGRGIARALM